MMGIYTTLYNRVKNQNGMLKIRLEHNQLVVEQLLELCKGIDNKDLRDMFKDLIKSIK